MPECLEKISELCESTTHAPYVTLDAVAITVAAAPESSNHQCWLSSPIMISESNGCKTGEYLCSSNPWETVSCKFKKVEVPRLSLEKPRHHLLPLHLLNHIQRSLHDAKVPDRFLTGRWSLLQTCHTTNWNLPVVLFHATIQSLNSKVDMSQFPFRLHCHCHQIHPQTWCP